jgi:pimeloyl-ACP methyl ester carboxylesterase
MINSLQPPRHDRGLTLVLPGIDSAHAIHAGTVSGLRHGGVQHHIEVHDWTTGLSPLLLVHLRSTRRHERQSTLLAEKIVAYQREFPGRPVNLVAHSAGAGIALQALEKLPEEHSVDRLIMLSSAVSPHYPLLPALRKTRCGVWNYWSYGDVPLAMAGTTIAGTYDGFHTPSAGAVGFVRPHKLTVEEHRLLAQKFFDRPYSCDMLSRGNLGGHFGGLSYLFARQELACILQEKDAFSPHK